MDVTLRDYQVEALEAIHRGLQSNLILLLQAATGAGKTVMVVRMIQKYFTDHPGRTFLILMHKNELVGQFAGAFAKFTNISPLDVGFACSSYSKTITLDRRILIASVQTLINHTDRYPGADLVVVDETHRVGHDNESQYQKLLNTLREYKPEHRTLGVTATAYRLGHGYIYGDKCKPGRTNFFPELTHRITYKELVDKGYLMPLKGFVASPDGITEELQQVQVKGDYNLSQLGNLMSKGRHVQSAVDGFEQYGLDHQSVCVFACTIEHAELLVEAFNDRGYPAVPIHSKLPELVRHSNLKRWQSGEVRIAVSINILVEGFDFPALSCLVFCRPTKSPTIYIQAIGRILRIAEGKEQALLIDLTDNTKSFGLDLDNPKFKMPRNADGEGGEAPEKVCPGELADGSLCGAAVHAALKFCPECGFEFPTDPEVEAAIGSMQKVEFKGKELQAPEIIEYKVLAIYYTEHTKKATGQKMMRVDYVISDLPVRDSSIAEYIFFPDHYDGYPVEKSQSWWEDRTSDPYPETVDEALFVSDDLLVPTHIRAFKDGKFWRIKEYRFDDDEGDTGEAGVWFFYHPGSDYFWVEYDSEAAAYNRSEAGVEEITKEQYDELLQRVKVVPPDDIEVPF